MSFDKEKATILCTISKKHLYVRFIGIEGDGTYVVHLLGGVPYTITSERLHAIAHEIRASFPEATAIGFKFHTVGEDE
jgi:hypothetical protein